ncbi:MAG: hypothetical protein ACOX3K_00645 [Bacilli bacterium]|jgi:hypothetical protein
MKKKFNIWTTTTMTTLLIAGVAFFSAKSENGLNFNRARAEIVNGAITLNKDTFTQTDTNSGYVTTTLGNQILVSKLGGPFFPDETNLVRLGTLYNSFYINSSIQTIHSLVINFTLTEGSSGKLGVYFPSTNRGNDGFVKYATSGEPISPNFGEENNRYLALHTGSFGSGDENFLISSIVINYSCS